MLLTDAPCRPTIAVSDKAKAMAYYGEVLGLTLVEENPVGATFGCGGTFLEIYPTTLAGTAKNTVTGFEVPDLEAAMRELRAQGVVFEEYDRPLTGGGDFSWPQVGTFSWPLTASRRVPSSPVLRVARAPLCLPVPLRPDLHRGSRSRECSRAGPCRSESDRATPRSGRPTESG